MLGESERDEFLMDSANRTRNIFQEKDNHRNGDTEHGGAISTMPPSLTLAGAVSMYELTLLLLLNGASRRWRAAAVGNVCLNPDGNSSAIIPS